MARRDYSQQSNYGLSIYNYEGKADGKAQISENFNANEKKQTQDGKTERPEQEESNAFIG